MTRLRPYQQQSIDALWTWFEFHTGNPVLNLPTGAGKSHIIAGICQRAFSDYPDARILMLTHVKELIEQNANKLRAHWPDAPLGIYSAGLGIKQIAPITFAGIQSIYRQNPFHVDLCIVDECHTISHKNQGIYRTYIDALSQVNPRMKVIGLTASPYRLGHGLITDKPALFDDIIEPVSIAKLQHQGYLCRLTSKATHRALSTDGVHKRGGEYIEKELQAAVDTDDNNESVVAEMISRAHDRTSWLIFCTGIQHAVRIQALLRHHGINAETVNAGTPSDERDRILKQFRTGEIQAVTNVGVLTTGFDAPNIDMIAMLRPTMSPGLYLQMVGRGLRIHPDKENCLVLDFAGNVAQHGTIHNIQPPSKAGEGGTPPCKVCDECMEIVHAAVKVCPACGFNFPPPKPKKLYLREDDIDGTGDITRDVGTWRWVVHTARSGVDCLRCTYYSRALSEAPLYEYYAVLAGGYGGMKAMEKLRAVADKTGADMTKDTLQELADELTRKRPPSQIVYRRNGKFFEVVDKLWKDEPLLDTKKTPVIPVDPVDEEDHIWF